MLQTYTAKITSWKENNDHNWKWVYGDQKGFVNTQLVELRNFRSRRETIKHRHTQMGAQRNNIIQRQLTNFKDVVLHKRHLANSRNEKITF